MSLCQAVGRTIFLLLGISGVEMMQLNIRTVLAVITTGVVVFLLSGCAMSEAHKAEVAAAQEVELKGFIDQARDWSEDIVAQIPSAEVESISVELSGGPWQVYHSDRKLPGSYKWVNWVVLLPDGPRTPTELADDLAPWLTEQGWVRNRDTEWAAGKDSFERQYTRGRYFLTLEVYTTAPPQAQSFNFTVATPSTDIEAQ